MTYEDIVFAYNNRALDARTWDMISDRERVEFVLRMKGRQEPVAWSRLDTAKSIITENEDIKRGWDLDGLPFKCLFDSPQPCPECAHYISEIKRHQSEIDALKVKKFARFNNDDCWLYQGDEDDHLESLACPVVLSPQQIIDLRDRAAECEKLKHELHCLDIEFGDVRDSYDHYKAECEKLKADRDITANILNRVRYEAHLEAADLVIDLGDDSSTLDARTLTVAANAIRALGTGMEAGK